MKVLNVACSLCVFHGVSVEAHSQHEVEVDDEGQLMEVQLLQLSRKVGKKSLEADGLEGNSSQVPTYPVASCSVGDHVSCPDGGPCAGDQCCLHGSTCPSAASNHVDGCSLPKDTDCTSGSAAPGPSPVPAPAPAAPAPAPPPPHHAPAPHAPAPVHGPPAPAPPGDDCGQDTACIVSQLNALYTGFDENDRNSPRGVTVRMATSDDFHINCGHGCFNGYSDCKMSASIYNHRVMRTHDGQVVVAMGRNAGMVFKQDAVENSVAKCFFQYDGGTYWNLNRGCGCQGSHDCNDPNGAYLSTASQGNPDVDRCSCDAYQQGHGGQLPDRHGQLCFWRGSAYDSNSINTDNNQLFDMLIQRLSSQVAAGNDEATESWNEVVLDGVRMQDLLTNDPYSVIQAFFYVRGRHGEQFAHTMQDRFAREYQGARIPVIELDPDGGSSGQPFREIDHRES